MKFNFYHKINMSFAIFSWCFSSVLWAQEIEPRRWAHLPVDSDILAIATVHTNADIAFDPVLKIEEGEVEADTVVASYLRSFGLLGKTARLDIRVPYQKIQWKGVLDGQARKVNREGMGDPLIRLSVNFLGAPALKGDDFRSYRSTHKTGTVVGAALGVVVPLGQYKKNKLLNIGGNRYIIRPQLGAVHTQGSWSYEVTGTVNFFTDNNDFWDGNKREQEPVAAVQTHVVHLFKNRIWGSLSAGYDWGGKTTVNGIKKDDKRENLFFAVSSGFSVTKTTTFKVAYIGGRTQKDIGNDSDSFVMAFAYRF